jgi:hypothetical protein
MEKPRQATAETLIKEEDNYDDDNDEYLGRSIIIVSLPIMLTFHTLCVKNILNITFRMLRSRIDI